MVEWGRTSVAEKFWKDPTNLEKILNAKAVVPTYGRISGILKAKTGGPSVSLQQELRKKVPEDPIVVPPDHLKKYPYQSVGKIYVFNTITLEEPVVCTAFFVGNDTIITAAHAFDKMCDAAMFVPAQLDSEDVLGRNFGHYTITERPHKHPLYKEQLTELKGIDEELKTCKDYSKTKELKIRKAVIMEQHNYFDICTAKISEGFHDGTPSRLVASGSPQIPGVKNVVLRPIKVVLAPSFTNNKYFSGTVIGYGTEPQGKKASLAPGGRMLEVPGFFMPETDEINESMEMVPAAWFGMSGGPWMFGHEMNLGSAAIGVQSMITERSSYSPYFSEQLLGKAGYHRDF